MMRKQEIEVVSLNIIKYYFLAIRELDFPVYDKPFKQIDVELFIKLADYGVTGTSVQKIAVVRHEKNKKCC